MGYHEEMDELRRQEETLIARTTNRNTLARNVVKFLRAKGFEGRTGDYGAKLDFLKANGGRDLYACLFALQMMSSSHTSGSYRRCEIY